MNNPSPLVPQGSLQQNARGRSNLKVAVFTILAFHVLLLGGLLFQGCKKKTDLGEVAPAPATNDTAGLSPIPPMSPTNVVTPTIAGQPGVASSSNAVPVPVPQAMPPSAPVIEPPAAPATHEYVVVKGDIVATIAKKNGVSQKALLEANPGLVPTKLKIGQKLQVPAGAAPVAGMPAPGAEPAVAETTVYVVKTGDTLTRIAKANGTTAKAIKSLNSLKVDQIKVGQKLKLPAAKPMAPVPEPMPVTSTPPAPVSAPTTASTSNIPIIAQPLQPAPVGGVK